MEKGTGPEVSEVFIYKLLDTSRGEIRLLYLKMSEGDDDVECELITTRMDENIPFEALSYTWGSQENKLPIQFCGQSFKVTRNLHIALRHLRVQRTLGENAPLQSHRTLWIDALCIDQSNVEERNGQVRQMWGIYSKAERVLV
jgi:hypothetical protein